MAANRTEFAILGLLADGPRSGYDIRKQVLETLSHFWHESIGHIYPMLRRLHGKGLVTRVTTTSQGRPPRHVYHITEDGLAELTRWLAEPVEPTPPRLEILLKVFFGAHTEPSVLIEHVAKYRVARERTLVALEHAATRLANHPDHRRGIYLRLTVSAGMHASRAAIAWCDEAQATLHALASREATPPARTSQSRRRTRS